MIVHLETEKSKSSDHVEFVRRLCEAGVEMMYKKVWGDGAHVEIYLDPEDVAEFVENPDAVIARHYSVSVEHYRRWLEFQDSGCQCTGLARGGRPCNGFAGLSSLPPKVHHFVFGRDDRCWHHRTVKGGRA